MLHLLSPNLRPADVYANSFGDAVSRVTTGYNLLQDALKNQNASDARRERLALYLNGTYLPKALVLFQPDDMAVVIAWAEDLKDEAEAHIAIND